MPRVLIVDDSEVDRRVAGGLVEMSLSAEILYAVDGKQALQQIEQGLPDLVLTDMHMPELNGLELVQQVRENQPALPVILMTAKGSEELAAEALRRGAASYVPKRRLAEDLPTTIRRVLSGARRDRGHSQLMHHLEQSDCVFTLHNDLELIKSLVNHLQLMLRCLALKDETDRLRVGIALEEALKNAYYHGNLEVASTGGERTQHGDESRAEQRRLEPPYRDRRIHVRVAISRSAAEFVIRDEGPGFDIGKLPELMDLETSETTHGRGVNLMRTIMDEVVFSDRGNEVTLLKRRAPETLEDADEDDEADD